MGETDRDVTPLGPVWHEGAHGPEHHFRHYWLSQSLTLLATQTNAIATQWLVLDLTGGSRIALGGIPLIQGAVMGLLSPLAGVAADRVARRDVLILCRCAAFVVSFGMSVLTLLGRIDIWHALLGVGLMATATAFSQPAAQAYIHDLVGERRLVRAIALINVLNSVFQTAGPAIGGMLIAISSVAANYLLAAGALVLSAVILGRIPARGEAASPAKRRSLAADLSDAVRKARSHPVVAWLLGMSVGNILAAAALILRPVIARDVLQVGAAGFGLMGAAFGAGAIVSALALIALRDIQRLGLVFFGSMIAWDVLTIVYGLSRSFVLTLACEFLMGTIGPLWNTAIMTMIQISAPADQRGRLLGFFFVVQQATLVGQFIAGALADRIGVSATMVAAGAFRLTLLLGLLLIATPVRDFGKPRLGVG